MEILFFILFALICSLIEFLIPRRCEKCGKVKLGVKKRDYFIKKLDGTLSNRIRGDKLCGKCAGGGELGICVPETWDGDIFEDN